MKRKPGWKRQTPANFGPDINMVNQDGQQAAPRLAALIDHLDRRGHQKAVGLLADEGLNQAIVANKAGEHLVG